MPEAVLDLPWPPADLNPNRARKLHWTVLHRAAKQYRGDCYVEAVNLRNLRFRARLSRSLPPPVTASVTFWMPDRRRRDLDNLLASLKPAWDGLVDAGLLVDDSADTLRITLEPPGYGKARGIRVVLAYNGRDNGDG